VQPGELDQPATFVYREILADFHTPLSAYAILAGEPETFLLESVQGGERWGRYSIIGLRATTFLTVTGHRIDIVDGSRTQTVDDVPDPLAWLDTHIEFVTREPDADKPRVLGGWVGFFGYAAIGYIEARLARDDRPAPLPTPDIALMRADELVVFDNLKGSVAIVVHHEDTEPARVRAQRRADAIEARLDQLSARRHGVPVGGPAPEVTHAFARADFEAAVERARRYIEDGDAMQVVLAQRMSRPYAGDAVDLYRAIRHLNPSPYLFLMDFGSYQVVGASPEILVRREGSKVVVRPIAGTRVRGATPEADRALAEELLADPKERAEHLMLIDLGRNDVGRLAVTGSVKVTEQMTIERYSHVMHIVSHVEGELGAGVSPLDLVRATFPAGTLSGAPKIRALEIIRELEPEQRGIYGGAVGYLGDDGNVDLAITIRSAVCEGGRVHVTAGAGVVFDSDPAREWEETMNKGRAMLKACDLVERGFDLTPDAD